jgi:hypothetical protein
MTVEDAPALGEGNAAIDDGPVASSLREWGRFRIAATMGMRCAADNLARFYLRESALPADPVVAHILGRCGVTALEPRIAVHTAPITAEAPGDEAIASGFAELATEARAQFSPTAIPFLMEVGSATATGETTRVWVSVVAPRRAALSTTRLEDGRFVISGRVESERMRAVEAWANQGEYGVARCETDRHVSLPDVRFICEMNPHDRTARVDLVAVPRQRLLSRPIATVLLHRNDDASASYVPPPAFPESVDGGDLVSRLAAALTVAREEAGQDALISSAAESARHARLLPKLAAARAGDDVTLDDTITLGLIAGWETSAAIVGGESVYVETHGADPSRFVRELLMKPAMRRLLLTAEADLVAIAARATDRGCQATFTTFRTFDEAKLPELRRAWTEHVNDERVRAGVSPLAVLDGVEDLQQEADRVTSGERHPREALDDAMARLRGRLGRTVRGFYVDAYDPRFVELPTESEDSGDVEAVTAVAWHRPEGAAWGQLVLYLCVFPE